MNRSSRSEKRPTFAAASARLLVVLGLSMLALSLLLSWQSAAQDGARATTIVSMAAPPPAHGSARTTLELALAAARPPGGGHVRGVVRIRAADGAGAVEVGRFSLAPGQGAEPQRYRFDITDAARRLDLARGPIEVEVVLIDRPGAGASVSIVSAQIAAR